MSEPQTPGRGELDLRETLGRAVRSAVNLRIVTIVGDAAISGSVEAPEVTVPRTGAAAVTNINLLEGDIVTCLSPALATGDLAEVRDFHDGMVGKAEGIVERNVRLVRELITAGFETFGDIAERRPGATPIGPSDD